MPVFCSCHVHVNGYLEFVGVYSRICRVFKKLYTNYNENVVINSKKRQERRFFVKTKLKAALLTVAMCAQLFVPVTQVQAAQTIYNNQTGEQDGYSYELWKDYGDTSMTLDGGGTFSCSWGNIGNALFRKGKKFDNTQTYQQIGNISFDYGCDYQPNGNSYLCVYGWTTDPLVEYYIVDSWGSWRPPGTQPKGQIQVDGGTYDVYETTRVNQPSIQGNTTFQQYFSVRTSKRTSGTISVSEHFRAWESMGMRCGKLYEAALNVEGYQSSGYANVYKNDMTIGGPVSSSSNNNGNAGNNLVTVDDNDKIQSENLNKSGQYTGDISSPFAGVALYGNDDSVSFTQYFSNSTHDFTLRGCSNNDNMARVDLRIGGEDKGTFYFGDANPAEYTIKNVSHKTGDQKVELIVTADDGQWDAYIDWIGISGISKERNNNNGSGNNNAGNNTGNSGQASNSAKNECEAMTKGGQYTGNINSPFDGVALYGNNDTLSFTQYFESSKHDFTLRGCSNNDNMARVDLKIGGEDKGTFYFGDANPAEYTIKDVTHKTGDQKVELIITADDGQWDAFVDWLAIGGISNTNANNGNSSNNGNNNSRSSNVTRTESENMTKGGQYTGNINSPFDGIALYGNNDSVSYTQYFASGSHDFTLRGCSNNDNMARVDLRIGGQDKGTFYFGDANPAEYTIKDVTHKTGDQKVELIITADDGQWDAYVDYLQIDPANSTNNQNGNNGAGNANQKVIALTFDDGPTSTTDQVLDILERYGIKATFFLIGQQVNSDTMATMQRQVNMGCELASHSYTHEDMSRMNASQIRNQMEWTSSAIKNTVGYDVKFFRPPYLATSNGMYENIDLPFIQGVGCNDYESGTSTYQRINSVLSNAQDGQIVLLHDFQGNSQTVDALPQIIEGLRDQGYSFVTVSQLFEMKGKNPNVEYKIWSNVNE